MMGRQPFNRILIRLVGLYSVIALLPTAASLLGLPYQRETGTQLFLAICGLLIWLEAELSWWRRRRKQQR